MFFVYDGGRHGLIVTTADLSTDLRWYAGTFTNTMSFANGMGSGKANTAIIIASQGYGDGDNYAARLCNEHWVTVDGVTYGDWYLPSKHELNLIYLRKDVVNVASDSYWSSSEVAQNAAAGINLFTGIQTNFTKNSLNRVRPIRAF